MKQNKCLLVGLISLMFSINSLYAQKDSLNVSTNNESYKRVYILDVGLGIGFTGIQKNGSSSWYIGNNKNDVPFVSSIQLMTYTPYSNIGCGLFYYDYSNGTKKHDGVLSSGINEKKSFYYVAPQISFIKRQARLGIRLGVNCLYAKIKGLHKNTSIGELSIRPREKFHLIVPSLEIGLS